MVVYFFVRLGIFGNVDGALPMGQSISEVRETKTWLQ